MYYIAGVVVAHLHRSRWISSSQDYFIVSHDKDQFVAIGTRWVDSEYIHMYIPRQFYINSKENFFFVLGYTQTSKNGRKLGW
jgi:hypothetical protein